MNRSRRAQVGNRHEAVPPHEIIDLTGSPSPPSRSATLPGRFSSRHTPYNPRERRGRDGDREREREREQERERDRARRTPAVRPPDAEIIDVDAIPDPIPFRRNDNAREERRHEPMLFPPVSPRDIELTFAHARVRQSSRDPFQPPHQEQQNHHHNQQNHHHHDPPRAASAGFQVLEMFRDIGMPFHRFGIFGSPNRAHTLAPLAPLAPHRDPPDMPEYPFRNPLFQAPGQDLDWFQIPHFAQNEEEVEITRQVHSKDPPIKEARKGFTRSPKSEDAIGCSMCDQELGDSDDDIQKQIWLMKCGHCYCGGCANAMLSQPRAQRGKRRQYTSCAIDGCRQPTTGKKFIWELYP
ncbi:hypothetical protein TWF730_005332 [Orbilia blumenaviensis]|uniref:RING-type domain-containing protein n=1 Tax=Orbilia blumenaviensis TaxID=1796055 RepID=A0AAV9VJ87_9PEZI